MTTISNLQWQQGSSQVSWKADGHDVTANVPRKVDFACPLLDGRGVLVIENPSDNPEDNAVLLEPNGRCRKRLVIPFDRERAYGFYQAYPDETGARLKVVFNVGGVDFAALLDPETGALENPRECR